MNEISSHDDISNNNNNERISEAITNTIYGDIEHKCLMKVTNNSQAITQNISNDANCSQINNRKDAKGVKILKRVEKNAIINHHAYFVDDINKNKNLAEIINMESYKDYNKKVTYNPEYGDGNYYYNTKIVENECCCLIT